jgi:hypothetical protein
MNLAKLNDAVLGSFALVPSSEILDHLVRYLSTWNGSDKLFMIIQYAVELIVPLLNARARIQHRLGLRKDPTSSAAQGWTKFGGIVSDSRMLWRIWGLLPIFQWLISLERNPPPTRNLLTIERLQGWSMLAYYPLEHIYYLCSHGIIPSSIPSFSSLFSSTGKRIPINADAIGIWSCRFWALYVMLQFAHLQDDRKLLQLRERSLSKAKGKAPAIAGELEELRKRWDSYWNELIANIGYLPLTIHWSLEKGLFSNDAWIGAFGLIAALASFRSGWKATALPLAVSSTPDNLASDVDLSSLEQVTQPANYDISS